MSPKLQVSPKQNLICFKSLNGFDEFFHPNISSLELVQQHHGNPKTLGPWEPLRQEINKATSKQLINNL